MTVWDRIVRFLAPPVFEGDEDKTRVARLLNTMVWIMLAVAVSVGLALPLTDGPLDGLVPIGVVVLLISGAQVLLRRGNVQAAAGLFSTTLWVFDTGVLFVSDGVRSPLIITYAVAIMVAGLLWGIRAALSFAGLSIAAGIVMFYIEWSGIPRPVLLPTSAITGVLALTSGVVLVAAFLYLAVSGLNEALGRARGYAAELEGQREALADLVEERTRDLARRTSYLGATTAVAREAAAVLGDPGQLLSRTVNVIGEQFGFYHIGLFLLDARGEWAELRAASSVGGRRMLERDHRLRVGAQGIVGDVASRGTHRVALDVGQDAVYLGNPDLPETRSEMALPLRVRGEVIGVLDVQSTEPEAFSEEDVSTLQALADQVAVAIDSARLYQQAEERVEAERRAYGELSREAWRSLLRAQPDMGYLSDGRETVPAGDLWQPEMRDALRTGQVTAGEDGTPTLAIPIRVRDQVVGVVDGCKQDGTTWLPEEIALMEAMIEQLNVALEGAQLYRDAQRREARERTIGQVTSRVRESLEMETMLKTAADEIRQALGLERIVVRLATPEVVRDS